MASRKSKKQATVTQHHDEPHAVKSAMHSQQHLNWRCMTSDLAAKGSAKDLEVTGAGPVHCHSSLYPSFLAM